MYYQVHPEKLAFDLEADRGPLSGILAAYRRANEQRVSPGIQAAHDLCDQIMMASISFRIRPWSGDTPTPQEITSALWPRFPGRHLDRLPTIFGTAEITFIPEEEAGVVQAIHWGAANLSPDSPIILGRVSEALNSSYEEFNFPPGLHQTNESLARLRAHSLVKAGLTARRWSAQIIAPYN